MSASDEIRGRIQGLREELAAIPPHQFNQQKIADRQRGVAILQAQLARIERGHQAFVNRRAELAARYHTFARNGGR